MWTGLMPVLLAATLAAQPTPAPDGAPAAASEPAPPKIDPAQQERWSRHVQHMGHPTPSHPWDATGWVASLAPVPLRAPALFAMDAVLPVVVSVPAALLGAVLGLGGVIAVLA